jgi:hypothetical protein
MQRILFVFVFVTMFASSLLAQDEVAGVVRDANGVPVEGAEVRITHPIVFVRGSPRTDANGYFLARYQELRPESEFSLELVVRHAERGLVAFVIVRDANKPVEVKLKLGGVLKGLVVDEDDKPFANATASAEDIGKGEFGSFNPGIPRDGVDGKTDAKGRYVLKGIPWSDYRVAAWADGYGLSEVGRVSVDRPKWKSWPATRPAGAEDDSSDGNIVEVEVEKIVLKAAKLSVTGVVIDSNGQPVAEAAVQVFGIGQPPAVTERIVRTDKSGKFTLGKLVEGKVLVRVLSGAGLRGEAEAKAGDKDIMIVVRPPRRDPSGGAGATSKPKGEDF